MITQAFGQAQSFLTMLQAGESTHLMLALARKFSSQ